MTEEITITVVDKCERGHTHYLVHEDDGEWCDCRENQKLTRTLIFVPKGSEAKMILEKVSEIEDHLMMEACTDDPLEKGCEHIEYPNDPPCHACHALILLKELKKLSGGSE